MYTFDKKTNDLTRVFKENYLVQSGENLWTSETNLREVTVSNLHVSSDIVLVLYNVDYVKIMNYT